MFMEMFLIILLEDLFGVNQPVWRNDNGNSVYTGTGISNVFWPNKERTYKPSTLSPQSGAYIVLGGTFDPENPKWLVLINFSAFKNMPDELNKNNRILLLEGYSYNPFDYSKFYYWDDPLNNTSYPIKFFTSAHLQSGSFVSKKVFKFVNLTEDEETRADVTLEPIGMTRENRIY